MLLEVEPPEGELQRRRIGFYERKRLLSQPVSLPDALSAGERPSLPLLLMSRPAPLTDGQARQAAQRLYREVYAGKPAPELP